MALNGPLNGDFRTSIAPTGLFSRISEVSEANLSLELAADRGYNASVQALTVWGEGQSESIWLRTGKAQRQKCAQEVKRKSSSSGLSMAFWLFFNGFQWIFHFFSMMFNDFSMVFSGFQWFSWLSGASEASVRGSAAGARVLDPGAGGHRGAELDGAGERRIAD